MEGTKGDVSIICLKIYKELPTLKKENDTVTLVINSLVFLPRVPEPFLACSTYTDRLPASRALRGSHVEQH